jgi:hypothetical protein
MCRRRAVNSTTGASHIRTGVGGIPRDHLAREDVATWIDGMVAGSVYACCGDLSVVNDVDRGRRRVQPGRARGRGAARPVAA